jgi:hypothetical protein
VAKTLTAEFEKERETKNKVRFAEVTDEDRGVCDTIYISKEALKELGDPDGLKIVISAA